MALTFDCCQTRKPAGYDQRIVRFLREHTVPATFFLCGRWIEAHPQATRELTAVPFFELANHSYIHPHLPDETATRVRDEIVRTQDLLNATTGRRARFFRPPYGEWDRRVAVEAAAAGMAVITWDVSTGDPDRHATVADLMGEFRKVKPGSVVLMHANGRGWRTAQALPGMLAHLRKKGLRPVTVSNLVLAGRPVEASPN